MKSGVALQLRAAHLVGTGELIPAVDLTWLFYDCEEVEAARNGLGRLERNHPDWLAGDFALLMEPTNADVEAGCQGTLRAVVTLTGVRAHTARNWVGRNAIHEAAPVLALLAGYDARRVVIDGCEFREGLSAVKIEGGVAGNVVPDDCRVTVNFRFAPDRSEEQAADHVRALFPDLDVTIVDSAPGALPGLEKPAAAGFIAAVGAQPLAKLGWTDVARFAALGIPAVNFGPGDPLIAHTADESVDTKQITRAAEVLGRYLTG
jgi:succinyl-diaminopimelate desuccinylase